MSTLRKIEKFFSDDHLWALSMVFCISSVVLVHATYEPVMGSALMDDTVHQMENPGKYVSVIDVLAERGISADRYWAWAGSVFLAAAGITLIFWRVSKRWKYICARVTGRKGVFVDYHA
jgi:hypothetical protein